jgi:hypothetical protein
LSYNSCGEQRLAGRPAHKKHAMNITAAAPLGQARRPGRHGVERACAITETDPTGG